MAPDVWTEAVHLTSKDRLTLPVSIRKRLPWLSNTNGDGLLAVLEPRGSVELVNWTDHGDGLVAGHRERLNHVPEAAKADVALALMDAFMRLSFEPPGRLAMPANLTSFLDADEEQRVRVVAAQERVWLWSERTWQARRIERLETLASCSPTE